MRTSTYQNKALLMLIAIELIYCLTKELEEKSKKAKLLAEGLNEGTK